MKFVHDFNATKNFHFRFFVWNPVRCWLTQVESFPVPKSTERRFFSASFFSRSSSVLWLIDDLVRQTNWRCRRVHSTCIHSSNFRSFKCLTLIVRCSLPFARIKSFVVYFFLFAQQKTNRKRRITKRQTNKPNPYDIKLNASIRFRWWQRRQRQWRRQNQTLQSSHSVKSTAGEQMQTYTRIVRKNEHPPFDSDLMKTVFLFTQCDRHIAK